MATTTFEQAVGIELEKRNEKPRKSGINMVIDFCTPWQVVEGYLDAWSAYMDYVKLTEAHLYQPFHVIQQKIELLRRHDIVVQPGGIIIEIARAQGIGVEALSKLWDMGFNQVEVSSSANTQRAMEEEAEYVQRARSLGFSVIGEVGKKFPEGDRTRISDDEIDVEETIREFKRLLEAGASYVYWEGNLTRRLIGENAGEILAKQDTGTRQLMEVANAVGVENIIFEVSSLVPRQTRRAMQFWFVRLFGPSVNIGNARYDELNALEATRRGTYPIFGFGPAGDHPWIHSAMEHGGKASETWWQEFDAYPSHLPGNVGRTSADSTQAVKV